MAARATRSRTRLSAGNAGGRAARDGRTQMQALQRARLLAGTVKAACEEGAANVTVATIVSHAGISRRTFYEIYDNGEECVLATIEDAVAVARERALAAWQQQGPWRARVRAALTALLTLFDERPQLAELLIVEWPAAGHAALLRRRRLLAQTAQALEQARESKARDPQPPGLAGEAVIGGALAVLHSRLLSARRPPRLAELTSAIMSVIAMPYEGTSAARRELARPAPQPARLRADSAESILEDLRMRLTERTVTVIAALAANPGASNRTIAEAAGIADQGQASKLLMRLQRLGLAKNTSGSAARRGQPNAWRLTPKGARLERTLRGDDR